MSSLSMSDAEFFSQVMSKIDEFNFGDGDDNAEAIFKKWAAQYADKFEDECDAYEMENKLE